MAGGEGGPPSLGGELAEDRCPNCGSVLTFQPPRPEGFCASCGIYIEIVKPRDREASPPTLVRDTVLHATKRELHDLCRAYGLKVSGNKTDLLTRLLRYMDDHGIDLPPEERGAAGESGAVAVAPVEEAVSSAETAADTATLELTPLDAETPVETEAIPEAATELPNLPEMNVDDFLESIHAEAESSAIPDSRRVRRDRIAFHLGTILAVVGGPGLFLGSVLHDAFRVPWVGEAYGTFGPLNVTAAGIGTLLVLAGAIVIAFGLRGGVVRPNPAGEA